MGATTVKREIPFSVIQFPTWEYLKYEVERFQGHQASPWQAACCGSIANILSAVANTPLDVAKAHRMLCQEKVGLLQAMKQVYEAKGVGGLFVGMVPRTCWIGVGGFVFFFAYEA